MPDNDIIDMVLFKDTMQDWQIAERAGEHLTEMQKKPWTLKVKPGGYQGTFGLDFEGPDGQVRHVYFEIQDGNLKVLAFPDANDDPHAIMTITQDSVVVESMNPEIGQELKGVEFSDHGYHETSLPVDPGFADDTAVAKLR